MPSSVDYGGATLKNATLDGTIIGGGGASTKTVLSGVVSSTNYIGVAVSGSLTSASAWTIRRTIYTSAGAISSTAISATNVAWDDRLTTSYT